MKDELGEYLLNCGYTVLPSGIIDWFHHCSIVLSSHWLWVLIMNPLLLLYCQLKDGLSRSIYCVFLRCACEECW